MRVGIFDPYLDTLGGGEKYILDIASCLVENNDVFIFWNDPLIRERWRERFNISSDKINIVKNIFSEKHNIFTRFFNTKDYDVIFYISDGSIPFLFSRKNILIFQFPVPGLSGKNIINKIKLKRINSVICYSNFVKLFIDKQFDFKSSVLPPYINMQTSEGKKENIILNVGRFTKGINTKKQEILIDEFKKLYDKDLLKWRFVLIGSYLLKDKDLIKKIKERIKGYPIDLLVNISYEELLKYYRKAKIYWHAAGFSEDLELHPEKAEHFGITTVEAMSNGVVPVVFNGGGQKEIVDEGKTGYLWSSLEELELKTMSLVDDDKLLKDLSENAKEKSNEYNRGEFCRKIQEIV